MIISFESRATSDLFHGISSARSRRLPTKIKESALYKLDLLNAAQSLEDLRSPPGNRLEALKGDFKGFHSVRLIISGALCLSGKMRVRMMFKLLIIINFLLETIK